MGYAQALVNGYWVVIDAAGWTYDFRVGGGGSFRYAQRAMAIRRYDRTPPEALVGLG